MIKAHEAIETLMNQKAINQNVEDILDNAIQESIANYRSSVEIPIVDDNYTGSDTNVILDKNVDLAKRILRDNGYNARSLYMPSGSHIAIDWSKA